jgi:hypothetical protein
MTPNPSPSPPHSLPIRIFTQLKEPGEAATLFVAIAAAVFSGKAGIKLFQGQGENSTYSALIQGLFTVAALFVVYYFRDRMRRTDRGAEIHKSDMSTGLDFAKVIQELTNNLNAANSERLKEQQRAYRATIASLNNKHALELAAERDIKHTLSNILSATIGALNIIQVRVELGVCTPEKLFDRPKLIAEHYEQQIEKLQIVPRPALEPEPAITGDTGDIHSTP